MQRVALADSEISLEYACTRSVRHQARKARREWIARTGSVPADLPMWTSRDGWLTELSGWLAGAGLAACAGRHIRPELVLRVAMVLAAHADHATGRNCAVANATAAHGAGCSERSVTTVRQVLAGAGLAVEVHRGTGSASTPGFGRRPSIWHLVSLRRPMDNRGVCDLPPSRSDRRLSPVGKKSPNARERAPGPKSHPPATAPKRGRRCAPRPLHVQLLAAGVIAGSHSLDRGHIGRICDALTESGLELQAWTAPQLLAALNTDMKARGWSWPDRVDHPGSFLLSRLRRLPVRPAGAHQGGVTAARPEHRRVAASNDTAATSRETERARTVRWHGDVTAVTTRHERSRLLRAHQVKFGSVADPVAALAGAGRRSARQFPDLPLAEALGRWAGDVLGEDTTGVVAQQVPSAAPLSVDLVMDLAIGNCDCIVCGSHGATARRELPLKSMVCDQCWPVIAAKLAEAGDIEEGMLA